jgi:hypothetical protein
MDNQAFHTGRIWISVATVVFSLSCAIICIYLGYQLFVLGATGAFKFSASAGGGSVGLESVAPGLAFAFFGAGLAFFTVWRVIGKP